MFDAKDRQTCIWVGDFKFDRERKNPRYVILPIKLCQQFKSYSLVLSGDFIGGEMTANPQP